MSPSEYAEGEEEVEVVEEEMKSDDMSGMQGQLKIKQFFTANGYQSSMGQYSKGVVKND